MGPVLNDLTDRALLNLVLIVGILDGLLLLALMYVAFVDRSDAAVSVLGPIHGIGYVILLGLSGAGAYEKRWGWWFPALVLVTGGPLGSIAGEIRLRGRARAGAGGRAR